MFIVCFLVLCLFAYLAPLLLFVILGYIIKYWVIFLISAIVIFVLFNLLNNQKK